MGFGLAFVLAGWSLAGAHFLTARFLKLKRNYWFCIAVSGFTCFVCMFSSGIVGIASLVTLFRPGVRELFEGSVIEKEDVDALAKALHKVVEMFG